MLLQLIGMFLLCQHIRPHYLASSISYMKKDAIFLPSYSKYAYVQIILCQTIQKIDPDPRPVNNCLCVFRIVKPLIWLNDPEKESLPACFKT